MATRLHSQPLKGSDKKIRILGIDPGSLITGFGVIDSDGSHNLYVSSGAIRTRGGEFPSRLKIIFEQVTGVIHEFAPDVVAVEQVFMSRNADSALKLGQARGAAIAAAVMQDLPVSEYTPRHIKQSVVGKGSASKQQVQHMVKVLLNRSGEIQADEADALAIALCHGHIGGTLSRLPGQHQPASYRRRHQ